MLRRSLVAIAIVTNACAQPEAYTSNPDAEAPLIQGQAPSWEDYLASATALPGGAFVVEGDMWLPNEDALREYYERKFHGLRDKAHIATQESTGNWLKLSPSRAVNIRYCVVPGSDHDLVLEEMKNAVSDWESIANVRFVYDENQDAHCETPQEVLSNSNIDWAVFVADLSHPSSPAKYGCKLWPGDYWEGTPPDYGDFCGGSTKFLRIDPADIVATGAPRTLRGTLRHEIGHGLGLTHEHDYSDCVLQGAPAQLHGVAELDGPTHTVGGLTCEYDVDSVMHYPEDGNTQDFQLSEYDGISIRRVYGMPVSWYVAAGVI